MADSNVIHSPYSPVEYKKASIYAHIEESYQKCPEKVALAFPDTTGTYGELREIVERVAYNLHLFGVHRRDVIALCSTNNMEYVLITLAAFRLDAVPCFINSQSKKGELSHYLNLSNAQYIFVEKAHAEMTQESISEASVKHVFTTESHPGCISWSGLDKAIPKGQSLYPMPDIDPWKQVAAYFFSSGTTGPPKAVELRHCTLLQGTVAISSDYVELATGNTVIYQPFSHVYGTGMLLGCLVYRHTAIIMPRFKLEEYIKMLSQWKVTHLQLVPAILVMLTKSPLISDTNILSHVRSIMVTTAHTSVEMQNFVKEKISKDIVFRNSYGMTEAVGLCTTPTPKHNIPGPVPFGSVGVPFPECKIKVCDVDTGKALGPGEQGELVAHAHYFMKGYLNNPEATSETLDNEGWLHTGDVGWYDKNGYFFIVDRLKEIMKYKGFQVSPSELEGVLLSHPGIVEAGVTSVPCELAGELPQAWVVKKDKNLTEKEVQDYVAERVSQYKQLRGGVRFVEAIPKSPTGKVLRRVMKEHARKKDASDQAPE